MAHGHIGVPQLVLKRTLYPPATVTSRRIFVCEVMQGDTEVRSSVFWEGPDEPVRVGYAGWTTSFFRFNSLITIIMIWRERAKKKTYHLPRCLFTREDVGSGISDEFRTGQSAFRTRSRGCGHGRVYLRQVTSSGTLAGSRPWKVRLQEDTGRVTFLQGNYSGCYVFVTALAYRAQSVRNEIRQQLPIFFFFFRGFGRGRAKILWS